MAIPKTIDAAAISNLPSGGGGGGGGGDAGSVLSCPTRAAAIATTVDEAISTLIVTHSGQTLFYRRYVEGGIGETYAPLKTNSGSVAWSPGADASPLHWGAMGDGVTNDRTALQDMMRFYFGTPATNSSMPAAWAGQRPLVVTGHQRNYAISAPLVWGNIGTAVDTGMVYNFRLKDLRLKVIAGDWQFPLIDNVPQRYMIMAGWNFATDYTDEYSGLYDVMLDHVTFDADFLTGWTWVCNTYQFVMNQCRYQHLGEDQVGCDTSVRSAAQGTRPFGYNTGNGAYTLLGPNFEGLVGESDEEYPGGNDIVSMGTVAYRVYTNDFRMDAPIASRASTAFDIYGSAGQIYNLHPWSREVRVRPTANNVMFCNGYLDYTKFIFESFGHMLIGMHWILPTESGQDRGVELRASVAATTGEGMLMCGCTFGGESLDVRYTATGSGTWVGDKARKVTMIGCKYASGHTIAQMERFEDKRGFTLASGAHWFSTGDKTIGEIRAVGDNLYIGKDKTVAGASNLQLQGLAGDQPGVWLSAYAAGGGALKNFTTGAFLELGVLAEGSAIFIAGATGDVTIKKKLDVQQAITGVSIDVTGVLEGGSVDIKSASSATERFFVSGSASATCAVQQFAGGGFAITNYHGSSGSFQINTGGKANALFITHAGAAEFGGTLKAVSYSNSSDERLKQNFHEISFDIDAIPFQAFDWKASGLRAYGVSAQELRRLMPELVTEGEDGMLAVDYIGLLVVTVKELRARVAELERKYDA